MMIRSIPRQLLIHSVVLQFDPSTDEWGNIVYKGSKSLSRVRVEPSGALKRDKSNNEVQLSALLIYDMRNSTPQGVSFALGDVIVFDGQPYTIASIDRLYDNRRLHHLEIGLV